MNKYLLTINGHVQIFGDETNSRSKRCSELSNGSQSIRLIDMRQYRHLSPTFPSINMLSLKADSVYDVVKPLHICSQLIDLTSFSIVKSDGVFVDTLE